MSTYKKDFTIKPSKYHNLFAGDVLGKIADDTECCVITSDGEKICAIYNGGYFAVNARSLYVTEATPIAPESQWPTGSDWSTDDWEDRGIYPPRPVQPAVLIVELSDGRTFEIPSPYTDETPVGEKEQKEYQDDLADYEARLGRAWFYGTLPQKASDKSVKVTTRWAWQENPKTK
jgi:hypothetical protein